MFQIDDALAEVVASSTQPALGAIRLAWWREALERLDSSPPPPEPRLQAAAKDLLPRGIAGKELAALEDGWAALLDEQLDFHRVEKQGTLLFAIGAKLLGSADEYLGMAGSLFARERLRRKLMAVSRDSAEQLKALAGHRFNRTLRPLTALARLAARDAMKAPQVEPEATPGRAAALLSHRLFGIVA